LDLGFSPCRDIYYAKYYGKGWPAGEKIKIKIWEKNKIGIEKRRKITLKRGKRP